MMSTRALRRTAAAALTVLMAAHPSAGAPANPPTAAEAKAFVDDADARLLKASVEGQQGDWVKSTFITDDTEAIAARANERLATLQTDLAKQATRFDSVAVPDDVRRRLLLLKLALILPAPPDAKENEELSRIVASLEGTYGKGKWCRPGKDGKEECLDITALERVMAESRDPKALQDAWVGWHAIARPMRKDFARYVELGNKGARGLGFQDLGALWRSKYDMPADDFARELDRLYGQVKPLYVSLHTYVRRKLREKYGPGVVPERGPIPAHLLGNMWAQSWDNVYPLVAPKDADPGLDLTARLVAKGMDPKGMTKAGERFFTSLGFAPLPETFWERSLFTQPRDRDVVCHASAWSLDYRDDLRIKMCIEPTGEDLVTIHHELGHNYYQRAYNDLPPLFRDSANDGFHEAIGDTIALSVTPEYLVKIGLLDKAPDASRDIGLLMNRALEKIAFLPFGLLIDQWRWKLFAGETPAAGYNKSWWELRLKYQGVAPPSPRGEEFFDPGAKYHVPDNTPYTRYFLAHILQFQFHRALSKAAGCSLPLHRCSIFESKDAGQRLNAMLSMGQSRPWQEALEKMTGSKQMDATAILDYFAPLSAWLDEQLKGQQVGW